jgi:hypothetical protein
VAFREPLEKVRRRLHDADSFRDPLVQRHAIFFREPLGSLLDGEGQLQWIPGVAHDSILERLSKSRAVAISISEPEPLSANPVRAIPHPTSAAQKNEVMHESRTDRTGEHGIGHGREPAQGRT